jgi:hypothetical protein
MVLGHHPCRHWVWEVATWGDASHFLHQVTPFVHGGDTCPDVTEQYRSQDGSLGSPDKRSVVCLLQPHYLALFCCNGGDNAVGNDP